VTEFSTHTPGTFCWAELATTDQKAGVAFYRALFGWDVDEQPIGPDDVYSMFMMRGKQVAAGYTMRPEERQSGAPPHWNLYVTVANADEAVKRAASLGAKVFAPPFDVMDAGRMAVFADPEGAAFCVWQAKNHRGAQIVNEAGSLNFNGLNTRDVEGAKSFYGSVFGWQILALDGGTAMWSLPGYGDHLEQANPDLRKQMADANAPAGFEDVVASINPIPADQPDVPAHWSVTFAVDDADAAAAKATELGGKVIVPPFDAPWVRMTVIADPQGATFIASKFVPENRDLAGQTDATASAA